MQRPIALVMLLAGRASLAQNPPPMVQVDIGPAFGRHGVGVIGYSMPEYPGLLRQVIGTVSAETIAAIQPFTLLIRNGGSLPIAKLVIGYPRSSSSGQLVDGWMMYTMADRDLTLAPGTTLVFTPDSEITRSLNRGGREQVSSQTLGAQSSAAVQNKFDRNRFPSATVSLDSIVLSDGSVIGPDRYGIIGFETRKADAENEVLNRLLDSSISDSDVAQRLAEVVKKTHAPGVTPDPVLIYQSALARTISQYLTSLGRSGTAQWLRQIQATRMPASRLHRVEE